MPSDVVLGISSRARINLGMSMPTSLTHHHHSRLLNSGSPTLRTIPSSKHPFPMHFSGHASRSILAALSSLPPEGQSPQKPGLTGSEHQTDSTPPRNMGDIAGRPRILRTRASNGCDEAIHVYRPAWCVQRTEEEPASGKSIYAPPARVDRLLHRCQ